MRKKRVPATELLVPREILEKAKLSFESDRLKPSGKCEVCGAECASHPTEQLCWVCRRLKISAWHEGDQQMSAQE